VILDNANEYLRVHGLDTERHKQNQRDRKRLFLITHNTENGVGKLATDMKRYIAQSDPNDAAFFDDLSHTLNSRRSKRLFRVAFMGTTHDEVIAGLEDISKGITRPVRSFVEPKICFAFTGMC
jgi:acyl transferase domain-containing protein